MVVGTRGEPPPLPYRGLQRVRLRCGPRGPDLANWFAPAAAVSPTRSARAIIPFGRAPAQSAGVRGLLYWVITGLVDKPGKSADPVRKCDRVRPITGFAFALL